MKIFFSKVKIQILVPFLISIALIGGQFTRMNIPFGGGSGAINFMDIALVISIIILFIKLIIEKKISHIIWKLWQNIISRWMIIFIVWAFFSLLINIGSYTRVELLIAFSYLVRLFAMFMISWLIIIDRSISKKTWMNYFIFSGIALVIIGFIQIIFVPDFSFMSKFGWDPHQFRMLSSFFDPNYFGAFCSLLLVILISRAFVMKQEKKYFQLFLIIITWIALYLTYSRSAWLVGAIALPITAWRYSKLYSFGILMIFVVVLLLPNRLGQRFNTISQLVNKDNYSEGVDNYNCSENQKNCDPSGAARVSSINRGLALSQKHILFGVGYNAYGFALIKEGLLPLDSITSHSSQGSDSSVLNILATTGIIGLLIYLIMGLNILVFLFKSWNEKPQEKYIGASLFGFSIAWVLGSFFNNLLFYVFILTPFLILLVVALREDEKEI